MMEDDQDHQSDLGGLDLEAWEAPPPPAALPDAVVRRMHEPVGVAALDVVGRGARRWWVAGGVLAIAGALTAVAVAVLSSGPTLRERSGSVATAKPSHLELGDSMADLEANTEVRWKSEGDRLIASQPTGRVTWKVGGNDRLVIDAGAMGASVEATGASLRTEVRMNLSDARSVGTAALTAAAVAMVTVIVYEGRVKVTSAGQTVNVAPGGTVEVMPGKPPSPSLVVGAAEDEVRRLREELARSEQRIKELDATLEATNVVDDLEVDQPAGGDVTSRKKTVRPAGTSSVDPSLTVGGCDSDLLKATGHQQVSEGNHAAALVVFERALACQHDGNTLAKAFLAACNSQNVAAAKRLFSRLQPAQQMLVQRCLAQGIDPRPANYVDVRSSDCRSPSSSNASDSRPVCANIGVLRVTSQPIAKVEIDGKPTAQTTPARFDLVAGRHKVTFVLPSGDRFTYPVSVTEGAVQTLTKDLR